MMIATTTIISTSVKPRWSAPESIFVFMPLNRFQNTDLRNRPDVTSRNPSGRTHQKVAVLAPRRAARPDGLEVQLLTTGPPAERGLIWSQHDQTLHLGFSATLDFEAFAPRDPPPPGPGRTRNKNDADLSGRVVSFSVPLGKNGGQFPPLETYFLPFLGAAPVGTVAIV
jgi:hypothetical protein